MKKKLILTFMLWFSIIHYSQSQDCLQADIMILIDWSGSEKGHELELATAASLFVDELPIGKQNVRVGLITFSDGVDNIVELSGDKEMLMDEIISISLIGASGGTGIEEPLRVAGKYLTNERIVPKIIIIISDGEIYDMEEALVSITNVKAMSRANVFAVKIGREGIEDVIKNLILLTGNKNNVEIAIPTEILEALKKLNICG